MKAKFIAAASICLIVAAACGRNPGRGQTTDIHDIQGCAHRSPLEGKRVENVGGIVTRKYSNGFVIQSDQPDELACSSEAIFVHTGNYKDVLVGQRVAVSGTVAEFTPGRPEQYNLSQTEITGAKVTVTSTDRSRVPLVELGRNGRNFPKNIIEDDSMQIFDPENDGLDFYESLEFMLVKLPEMTVTGPRNAYNEIVAVEAGEGQGNIPAVLTKNNERADRLMIALPDDWTQKVNAGDIIQAGVEGVVAYDYGSYKVEPINEVVVQAREEQTVNVYCAKNKINILRIANYNTNNFSQYSSSSKISRLAVQIIGDLCSPDLIILEEVEDDSGEMDNGEIQADNNLVTLTDAILAAGGPEYTYFDFPTANNSTGGIAGGNIRTVFLLRKDSPLRILSSAGELTQSGKISFDSAGMMSIVPNPMTIGWEEPSFENSRKPIVGLFTFRGRQIVVVGLHLVSQGANSPEYGSIQPILEPEKAKRMAQAEFVNRFVETILDESPDTIVIVAGDMNSGYASDVLQTLEGDTLIDSAVDSDEDSRYSIIMDGGASLFDHILVSRNVSNFSSEISHLNTPLDESAQTSDHDPVVTTIVFQK